MSVYMITEIEVIDATQYAEYVARVPAIVAAHGGHYLVRGGAVTPFAGNWTPERIIVIEFPDMEHARQCFSCEEYRALAPFRERATASRAVLVEGCG